jgi:hypothetical protein
MEEVGQVLSGMLPAGEEQRHLPPTLEGEQGGREQSRPLRVGQLPLAQQLDAPLSHERKNPHVGVVLVHNGALTSQAQQLAVDRLRGFDSLGEKG